MLDVIFLNNFQVFLKGLKGRQEVLRTISQGFVLIIAGIGLFLEDSRVVDWPSWAE